MKQAAFSGPPSLSAPRVLALAFALVGMIGTALASVAMPTYQAPDEPLHMMRTWQISQGQILGTRLDDTKAGGMVDPAIWILYFDVQSWLLSPLGSPDQAAPEVLASASAVRWRNRVRPAEFPSTAIYPPHFYFPAAAALLVGRAMDLPVQTSLILVRMAQSVTTVALGSLAIALSGAAAPWLFVLLTLPMTLAQAGACSPDGPMIATGLLAAGLLVRIAGGGVPGAGWRHGLATLALTAIALNRQPYLPLALLLLVPHDLPRWRRWGSLGFVVACTLGWTVYLMRYIAVPFGLPGASLSEQTTRLLAAPWRFLPILIHTYTHWAGYTFRGLIGVFGRMNIPLPEPYYPAAEALLVLGIVLAVLGVAGPGAPQTAPAPARRCAALAIAAIALCFVTVAGALFLSWTPIGIDEAFGLQGRYFLPVTAFLPLAFAGLGLRRDRLPALPRAVALALPVVFTGASLVAMLDALAPSY